MMQQIQLKEAESNFTELIRKSLAGDEFVIMIDGKPALRLTPFMKKKYSRRLGTARGQVVMKEGFKEIPEGFEEYMP
jgi:antitoxin (DNA-binding transcriptional repressor) of toxin-antitoxin stability system